MPSQSREPLCNALSVNLLPSSFALGVCNKTPSFNILHSLILQLIRSKSCKWKIKHQDVPCTLTPFTSKLLPCPFVLLALSSLRPLLPFHVTQFTVSYYRSISPHFPSLAGSRWDLSNAVSAVPPSGLRHESQPPSKALLQKGLPIRLSPLWLPALARPHAKSHFKMVSKERQPHRLSSPARRARSAWVLTLCPRHATQHGPLLL